MLYIIYIFNYLVVGFQSKFLCWVHVKVDFFIQMLRKIGRNSSSIRLWMGINQRVEWVSPFFVLLQILEVCNAVLLIDASLFSFSRILQYLCFFAKCHYTAGSKQRHPSNCVIPQMQLFFLFSFENHISLLTHFLEFE